MNLPLYFWRDSRFDFINFGDELSLKIVERITGGTIQVVGRDPYINKPKLLAAGSILHCAQDNDTIWGSGMHPFIGLENYRFKNLDIRALRGPKTRDFLKENFKIDSPEIYGDPVLLMALLFPEFKVDPIYDYVIVPHFTEQFFFPKHLYKNVVYPTDPWEDVVKKILQAKFVISSSLHGIILAESYGIPARYLRITEYQPLLKYQDYYLGTGRPNFKYAVSVKQAIEMKGEEPFQCDLQKLYEAFPFDIFKKNPSLSITFN